MEQKTVTVKETDDVVDPVQAQPVIDVSIVVPTYEERENIKILIPRLADVLSEINYEVIVVDDDSPDGTAREAERLSENYPVRVIKRNERGLASAILTGFKHAHGDIIGVIDADMQHPPECCREFIDPILDGYDIVLGSRYTEGGKIEGWSLHRKLISKGAILLAKPLIPEVKDPITGFFFLKKTVLEDVEFNPTGYKLSLEILAKGNWDKVKELPFTFKIREKGESKLDLKEIFKYLHLIGHLYKYRVKRSVSEDV